jgi:hypothetical protein
MLVTPDVTFVPNIDGGVRVIMFSKLFCVIMYLKGYKGFSIISIILREIVGSI